MKIIFIFLLISKSYCYTEIVDVTDDIIESALRHNKVTATTFIDATSNSTTREVNDFIAELLAKVGSDKIFERINLKTLKNSKFKKRLNSNVIIVNELEDFRNFVKTLNHKIFNFGGFYIVIFKYATYKDAHEIFQTFWDFYIYNVNLVRHIDDSVVIVETFMPFQLGKCNKTNPITIARYENGEFTLKPDDFYPLKFQNFNQCPLKVTTYESLAPSVIRQDWPNGSLYLYGRDVDTYTTLSQTLNFKMDIFYIAEFGGWGYYNANGTVTGGMARAIRRETEFIIGNNNLKYDRSLAMSHTYGYYLESLVLMIPPGYELSSFRKLIRPFDNYVWFCLVLTFIITTLVIIILQFQSKTIKNFVYGTDVKSPCMNVLTAIVGGSQEHLPRRNFARSLLMMFLLFCVVIRSVYQGSLYQFLQQNDLEPDPISAEEIAKKNYTFHILVSWDELTVDNSAVMTKRRFIQPAELKYLMNKTLDKHFGGALMNVLSEVLYRNKLRSVQGMQMYKVCKEFYTMIPIVMYFPKNSYLVDPFNMQLLWFESAGLVHWWQSNYGDMKYIEGSNEVSGPKSLNISHLSATFQFWLCSCFVGIILFIFEIIFSESRIEFYKKLWKIFRTKFIHK